MVQGWHRLPPLGLAMSLAAAFVACSSGGVSYGQTYLTSADIVVAEHESAYDVLKSHRRLIVTGSQIMLKGGNDLAGRSNEYSDPLIVINGDYNIANYVTVLELMPADDVAYVRLYSASDVPATYRNDPQSSQGVVEIQTKSGTKPAG
jgi:hypothetical protein